MDNCNNFIYAISTSEIFINNGLEEWDDSVLSFVTSSRSKAIEKIYNLYEDYKDAIEISVEIWFDGEDEFSNLYYPISQAGKPMQNAVEFYEKELKFYEQDLILKYQLKFNVPIKKESPKKIENGILVSCERLFKDEMGKNHYKATFNFDLLNIDTNENYGKCIINFPNLTCDCYLEDFIGLTPDLLNINICSSINNGLQGNFAVEIKIE